MRGFATQRAPRRKPLAPSIPSPLLLTSSLPLPAHNRSSPPPPLAPPPSSRHLQVPPHPEDPQRHHPLPPPPCHQVHRGGGPHCARRRRCGGRPRGRGPVDRLALPARHPGAASCLSLWIFLPFYWMILAQAGGWATPLALHPSSRPGLLPTVMLTLMPAIGSGPLPPVPRLIPIPPLAPAAPRQAVMSAPEVSLVLATGGPSMVRAAYSSGHPALGVGAGNTPAVIDETADVQQAVSSILLSKASTPGLGLFRRLACAVGELQLAQLPTCSPRRRAAHCRVWFRGAGLRHSALGRMQCGQQRLLSRLSHCLWPLGSLPSLTASPSGALHAAPPRRRLTTA